MQSTIEQRPRIHFLDEFRGLSVILMIIYHLVYDLALIMPIGIGENWIYTLIYFQPIFAIAFILISGIVSNFSRSSLRRGFIALGAAILVSLATLIVMPDQFVRFGILHFLGLSMIIGHLLRPLLKKLPATPSMIVCAILFIFTFNITKGYLGIDGLFTITIPDFLREGSPLFIFGLIDLNFTSVDYYPIIPWIFVFLFGIFLGRYAKNDQFPKWMYKKHSRFFSWVGRHSLWIYLAHQPILYGILLLISYIQK